MPAILAYIKREPVRVATIVVVVAVAVISMTAGVPAEAIVAQVVAYAAVLERVRKAVAPMVNVIVHAEDLQPADLSDPTADEAPAPEDTAGTATDIEDTNVVGEPLSDEEAGAILNETPED